MPLSLEIQLACRTLALRAARLTAEQARRNAMAKGGEFWQEIADSVKVFALIDRLNACPLDRNKHYCVSSAS